MLINLQVMETGNARTRLFRGFEVNGVAKPLLNPDSNWYLCMFPDDESTCDSAQNDEGSHYQT